MPSFEEMDLNHDGVIDKTEHAAARRRLDLRWNRCAVLRIQSPLPTLRASVVNLAHMPFTPGRRKVQRAKGGCGQEALALVAQATPRRIFVRIRAGVDLEQGSAREGAG